MTPALAPHLRRRLVAALLAGALGITACGSGEGDEVRLTIRKGSSFREAAESLAVHQVISSPRLFSIYGKLRGHDRSLRFGTYVLRGGMSWEQTLNALRAGKGIVHQVTIPEGFLISDITPLLVEALGVAPESLEVAVRDTAMLHRLDVPTPTLEGYLFPDTYVFADGTSARDAVRTMVDRFESVWKPEWNERLKQIAMHRHDIITLASIVEKEVAKGEERPVVAAVYMNRLRIGMNLQADPTVQYALKKKPGKVYLRDLKVRSPYNTYLVAGLPPGPIASPGAASIQASLYPAKVPYRYFVAAPDGHHEFRRTYAEHLAAIEMVRRMPKPDSARADSTAGAAKPDSAVPSKPVVKPDSNARKGTPRKPATP